jgi:hypothetical protein
MHRVALALLWMAFSTWYSYCLRPVDWLVLTVEPVQAHFGIMSTLFPESRMQQVQALIDAGVPVASGKGFTIPQEGGTILFTAHSIPMRVYDLHFLQDTPGKPVIYITASKEN